MIDYKIHSWQEVDKEKLSKGLYIWVIHVNKIPPHIGISIDGKFYSLKVNGKDVGVDFELIYKIIQKKQIQTLFVEIDSNKNSNIESVFEKYKSLNNSNTTCLSPIIEFLHEDENIKILVELLVNLDKKNQIKSFFGLNLGTDFEGIPVYSLDDVQNRILKLKDAKRSKHIS
ncbi:MAG: hypothetical protein V4622_10965 [Bacteroidota bacterium]